MGKLLVIRYQLIIKKECISIFNLDGEKEPEKGEGLQIRITNNK